MSLFLPSFPLFSFSYALSYSETGMEYIALIMYNHQASFAWRIALLNRCETVWKLHVEKKFLLYVRYILSIVLPAFSFALSWKLRHTSQIFIFKIFPSSLRLTCGCVAYTSSENTNRHCCGCAFVKAAPGREWNFRYYLPVVFWGRVWLNCLHVRPTDKSLIGYLAVSCTADQLH